MIRTFDVLNGDVPGENTAETIADVAQGTAPPAVDLAALVARFNDIDARINKLEGQVNDAFKSQIDAPKDAVAASAEIADNDNPGNDDPAGSNDPEPENNGGADDKESDE